MAEIQVELTGINKWFSAINTDGKLYSISVMYDPNSDTEDYNVTDPDSNKEVPKELAEMLCEAVAKARGVFLYQWR